MTHPAPPRPRLARSLLPLSLYAILLLASFLTRAPRTAAPTTDPPDVVRTHAGDGRLPWVVWRTPNPAQPPIVLIHGSPGGARDFQRLAQRLLDADRPALAPDLLLALPAPDRPPGFSLEDNARHILAGLDDMNIGRAHLVGWSNGGGTALAIERLDPRRVASITLLASIGDQRFEGSGSHAFEHAKYRATHALLAWGVELVPHFGLLGTPRTRTAWLRNFMDSDQRDLTTWMRETAAPTLILHGRHDPLVPVRSALDAARAIRTSRLVVLDASHFLPFLQPDETARAILEHARRHDQPGAVPLTGTIDLAPVPEPVGFLARGIDRGRALVRDTPWWGVALAGALGVALFPGLAVAVLALLVAARDLDPVVALVAIVAGSFGAQAWLAGRGLGSGPGEDTRATPNPIGARPMSSATDWRRRVARRALREGLSTTFVRRARDAGAFGVGLARAHAGLGWFALLRFALGRALGTWLWGIASLVAGVVAAAVLLGPARSALGSWLVLACVPLLVVVVRGAPMLLAWRGRRHVLGSLGRLRHHEYWPAKAFYLPLIPYAWWLGRRFGGFSLPTCVNPEIEHGGGWVGESKWRILGPFLDAGLVALPGEARSGVLPSLPIPAGEVGERVRALEAWVESTRGVLPVVLKPDVGQRGFAFKLIRSRADAERYFAEMTRAAIAQAYHPGPEECGILWVRRPGAGPADGPLGEIYGITRKRFPRVEGDGVRTLEELVLAHRRFRCQAHVYLDRCAGDQSRIVPAGELVRLATSGNHCQGTLFCDGSDLITPELSARVDELARAFPRLDIGRFDVRFSSEDGLRRGEGMGIVELNGVTSEPAHMYDPDRGLLWAYGVLFGLWRRIYELGGERRREGVRPLGPGEILAASRRHARERTGNALAD